MADHPSEDELRAAAQWKIVERDPKLHPFVAIRHAGAWVSDICVTCGKKEPEHRVSSVIADLRKAEEVADECQDLYEFHQGIGEPPTVLKDSDTAKALGSAAQCIRELVGMLRDAKRAVTPAASEAQK